MVVVVCVCGGGIVVRRQGEWEKGEERKKRRGGGGGGHTCRGGATHLCLIPPNVALLVRVQHVLGLHLALGLPRGVHPALPLLLGELAQLFQAQGLGGVGGGGGQRRLLGAPSIGHGGQAPARGGQHLLHQLQRQLRALIPRSQHACLAQGQQAVRRGQQRIGGVREGALGVHGVAQRAQHARAPARPQRIQAPRVPAKGHCH